MSPNSLTFLYMLAGLIVWSVRFLAVSSFTAIACSRGWTGEAFAGIGLIPFVVALLTLGSIVAGRDLSILAPVADIALTLPNSREGETEADRYGIELAARAGYDPNAAVRLWEKMAVASGGGPPAFLSTHPAPANRIQALNALVPQMTPLYQKARR